MKRDNQRRKVYNSEFPFPDNKIGSIHDVREFVTKITKTKFWKNMHPVYAKKYCMPADFYSVEVKR